MRTRLGVGIILLLAIPSLYAAGKARFIPKRVLCKCKSKSEATKA
jgi:hypothetical protein